jgi:formylglycine-generating enzyme required for sulfatase activity
MRRASPCAVLLMLTGTVPFVAFLVALVARSGDARGAPTPATAAACPAGMVLVPGGTVSLGAPDDPDALPPTTRAMSPFCIDRTEVTVAQYRACVTSGACPSPEITISFPGYGPPEPMRTELSHFCNAPQPDRADHPMNCVEEATAAQFCAWEGGRLPDEEEWEHAARGTAPTRFPWGSLAPAAPAGDLCWDRRVTARGTCAVGQFPAGASQGGALDMAGNVWEWTTSHLGSDPSNVVRGGGWTNFLPRMVSATYRWPLPPTTRLNCLGFRCVRPL